MELLTSDFKHVLRRFGRSPIFTAITLATLAIGIGANTAVFTVVNAVLLKPLPYPQPEQLVGVWEKAPGLGFPELNASPSTYFTFREENRTFQQMGLYRGDSVSITGLAEPEQVDALDVTDGTLSALKVQPFMGRRFTLKDDSPGSPQTVILTYGYWRRRFGGDPSAIGRRLVIDGKARDIIGVLPKDFTFMNMTPAVVLPFQLNRNEAFVGNFSYESLARLKPGVTLAQANADVARMLPMLAKKFRMAPGLSVQMLEAARLGPNLRPLKEDVVGDIGKVLWVLMATVGIVLFIACANVANLLLVRAEGRQRELAIRAALGAGWARIARELLFESIVLGIIGGILGLALAWGALRVLVRIAPANLPRVTEISINPRVLLFTAAVSLLAGLLFGLVPVFKYAGPHLANALREGGRSLSDSKQRHRTRSTLVIVQVALALVLLISSGLMIRSFRALRSVQPGFTQPDRILTFRISIPDAQVPDPVRVVRMYDDMQQKIAAIPGVRSVSLVNAITMSEGGDNDPIFVEDHPTTEGKLPALRRFKFVTPGLFQSMGNPLLAGRDYTWADIYEARPVLLVSENFAREYWHTPSAALGKRIRENTKAKWREIIGIVGNERDDGVDKKAPEITYWPILIKDFWGDPVNVQRSLAFAVRSSRTGSSGFLDEVRRAVWSVNPNVPFAEVRTVQQIYNKSMARTSFTLVMLAVAAGMALLLGLVGIYGVISYSVSQRTREVGIRMALGAGRDKVRKMFLQHGFVLAAVGVACGLAASFAVTRLMATLLFEVSPIDPITYLLVSIVLMAAALLASYLPAHRATAIDPMEALRAE